MDTINVNELLTSGLGFSIQSADADFDDSGELTNIIEVTDLNYRRGGAEKVEWDNILLKHVIVDPAPESEPLTDTTSLLDDDQRWEHLRDAHIEESVSTALCANVDISGTDYGTYNYHRINRYRRTWRLRQYISRTSLQLRRARKHGNTELARKLTSQLHECRAGIRQRYGASVHDIVSRGKDEWWRIYLSRAQVDYLSKLITSALR